MTDLGTPADTAGAPAAQDTPWDAGYEELLGRALPRLAQQRPLRADTSLKSAGLDSLALVELLIQLEGAYGISVPDEDLVPGAFETPAALWSLISAVRTRQTAAG